MTTIDRLVFTDTLPEFFFFGFGHAVAGYRSDEQSTAVRALFRMEAARSEIIIYNTLLTEHSFLQLVGIFPNDSTEAYFGYWETVDDATLNQRAFALLEYDARQRGRTVLIGPINFNTFHRYRLRLPPVPSWGRFDREPVNPVYYPALLEQLSFRVRSRFESRLLKPETIPELYRQKESFITGLPKIPFDFIPLTPDVWQEYETELFTLTDVIFRENPAYKPIPKAQFALLYNRRFAEQLCPYSSVLVRDRPSGRLVGLSFCQPNYQSLAFAPDEPPNFERDYPRLTNRTLLVKTVGVHPGFRGRTLMSCLGAYAMLHFRELYTDVIFCLMRTDNFSRHFSDGLPYERAEYALFEKPLTVA